MKTKFRHYMKLSSYVNLIKSYKQTDGHDILEKLLLIAYCANCMSQIGLDVILFTHKHLHMERGQLLEPD